MMTAENTLGQRLRESRQRLGLSVAECAQQTRISARFLDALEAEHWDDLPSESHRLGFLRLYARFLQLPLPEIEVLYQQRQIKVSPPAKPEAHPGTNGENDAWGIDSWQKLMLGGLILLFAVWGLFHFLSRHLFSDQAVPLQVLRPRTSRMVVKRSAAPLQHVRIVAQGDCWLRVTVHRQLLFDGILRAGLSKEWASIGPFVIKMGNAQGAAVYWNDQPVDVKTGAHGRLNEIILPPPQ